MNHFFFCLITFRWEFSFLIESFKLVNYRFKEIHKTMIQDTFVLYKDLFLKVGCRIISNIYLRFLFSEMDCGCITKVYREKDWVKIVYATTCLFLLDFCGGGFLLCIFKKPYKSHKRLKLNSSFYLYIFIIWVSINTCVTFKCISLALHINS